MNQKTLLFRIPISLLVITLVANCLGFAASTISQSIYIIVTDIALTGESNSLKIDYSIGASSFIATLAVPFSLILICLISSASKVFTKVHLFAAIGVALFFGLPGLSSIYWGVPLFAYSLTTAVSSVLLIMWKQKTPNEQG